MDKPPESPQPHKRRARYRGTHPRRFDEKYKEHAPHQYPETTGKVLASGKTPAGSHVPIMVDEILAVLTPGPGMIGVDATLGHGGHAEHILPRLAPGGVLIGMDVDPLQLPRTEARLRALGHDAGSFRAVRSNFAGIGKITAESGPLDFLLADLGCSSMQIDDPSRGFTFKADGPLDMRMNPGRGLSARAWLARVSPATLAGVLRDNADEDAADHLADVLAGHDWPTTTRLTEAIRRAHGPGKPDEHIELSVRKVFQAVRIAVNDEFSALDALLRALPDVLAPGGRVAFLTFHSGEDRRVKKALLHGMRAGIFAGDEVPLATAGAAERRANPRSIPAKLRWATRTANKS